MPTVGRNRRSKADKAKRGSTTSNASRPASVLTAASESAKSTTRGQSSSHVRNEAAHKDATPKDAERKSTSSNKPTTEVPQKDVPSKPNVFDFLDDNEETDSDSSQGSSGSTSSSKENDNGRIPAMESPTRRAGLGSVTGDRHSCLPSDLNSEPGSSFRTSSPDQTFSVASKDSTSTDFESATLPDASPETRHLRLAHSHIAHSKLHVAGGYETESLAGGPEPPPDHNFDYSAPETYYIPSRANPLLRDQPSSEVPTEDSESLRPSGKRKTKKAAMSPGPSFGYACLASKLDSSVKDDHKLPPLYRRFEAVNHRVLLYLQDEIAQMEEELQRLDEYEEKHRIALAQRDGTKPAPASRRMDAEAQAYSSFHSRRMALLEKLTYKTHQYSKHFLLSCICKCS